MRRRRASSLAANPVLVGAVTTLVVLTAVFLAYNANRGLPFVPTFELHVESPNAARLVVGNDVREGGERIGQVTGLRTVRRDGRALARITMSIDQTVTPLPDDTRVVIRPRSTLGLKYVDLVRGRSGGELESGSTVAVTTQAIAPELDDLFSMFDEPTREAVRTNLTTFGDGLAGRGAGLNQAFADAPQLLGDLVPVMRTLADEDTGLRTFLQEAADAAGVTAPLAAQLAEGLGLGGDVFEAISRDPDALRATIAESASTVRTGIRELPAQRPFLRQLAALSDEVSTAAREIRAGVGPINQALVAGTRALPQATELSQDLRGTLESLRFLASSPTTNLTLEGLEVAADTLNPTLRYLGPHVTVCNSWNYLWTYLSDHLAQETPSGTVQRIQVKHAGSGLDRFGAPRPANGEPALPGVQGDPAHLHAQPYGRAVDERGDADCEHGQRGYPRRLAEGAPEGLDIAVDPRTPGNQGPPATGRPRVPEGQTFSAEPTGRAAPYFEGITR
jgi:ABC-type transporter Mla subunit MlaD